jgi:hypothetical protein
MTYSHRPIPPVDKVDRVDRPSAKRRCVEIVEIVDGGVDRKAGQRLPVLQAAAEQPAAGRGPGGKRGSPWPLSTTGLKEREVALGCGPAIS